MSRLDISPAAVRVFDRVSMQGGTLSTQAWLELFLADESRITAVLGEAGLSPTTTDTTPISLETLQRTASDLAHRYGQDTLTTDFAFIALGILRPTLDLGIGWEEVRIALLGEEPPPLVLPSDLLPDDTADAMQAARILDVNANRARESLRVLDDYARFVIEDHSLTTTMKSMRHELTETLKMLPARMLISARDTVGDVGTQITVGGEMQRSSTADVARINAKRLQESLRSIEEFGKRFDGVFAGRIEALRYRAYTLEKRLPQRTHLHDRLQEARVYVLVTGSACKASIEWTIAEAAAGGASIFQLREKEFSGQDLLARARRMRQATLEVGALFIVNDRPDIAKLADADGVHLGQDDLPLAEVRKIVGPDMLIGVSTHNAEQLEQAIEAGADYVGIGPTFPSTTKAFETFPGLEMLRMPTSLPAFAIGGIDGTTIERAVNAGARRVAVSRAVIGADDPRTAVAELRRWLS